jgi:hypothetical protein
VILRRATPVVLVQALGLGVVGVILASPLFSSQFLFWLVPFVLLLAAPRQRLYVLASLITFMTVILWTPLAPAWSVMVLARNALLLILAAAWARDLLASEPSDAQTTVSEHVA